MSNVLELQPGWVMFLLGRFSQGLGETEQACWFDLRDGFLLNRKRGEQFKKEPSKPPRTAGFLLFRREREIRGLFFATCYGPRSGNSAARDR